MNGKTTEEILRTLEGCPDPGTIWCHVKTGNLYRVQQLAINEATLEPMVIYYRAYEGQFCWARPLSSWKEKFVETKEN